MRLSRRTALAMPAILVAGSARSADARIDLVHLFSGADHPAQKVIAAFNDRKLGVTVVSRQEGTTYETITTKAMAGIAAGRPPAIMTTGWKLADFAKKTLGAQDFNAIYGTDRTAALMANFRPGLKEICTVGGSLVGLPWAMSTPVLYVNMTLWKQAGLDPAQVPTTIEALYPLAKQLQERTSKQGLIFEVNEWLPQAFIQNAGGDVITREGQPAMDSAAAIHAIERFVEPRRMGIWNVLSIGEMVTAFQSGAIGVMASSSARQSVIRAQAQFELALFQMPGLDGRQRRMNSGGNFLAVYATNREQREAALTFFQHVASAEGFRPWLATGYMNTTVHDLPAPGNEAAHAQLAGGLTSETIWPGPRGLEALQAHIEWVSRIVNGAVTVSDGLRGSRQAVERLISNA